MTYARELPLTTAIPRNLSVVACAAWPLVRVLALISYQIIKILQRRYYMRLGASCCPVISVSQSIQNRCLWNYGSDRLILMSMVTMPLTAALRIFDELTVDLMPFRRERENFWGGRGRGPRRVTCFSVTYLEEKVQ